MNNILFSDEKICSTEKQPKIRTPKTKDFSDKYAPKIIKHGGGSVMVWGYMAAAGVGNLVFIKCRMNKMDYLNFFKQCCS